MRSPTGARIADAARRILVAEGSAAVTMRRVAGVVGVTPMAIYRHYANRDELLRTIAATTVAELDAAWRVRSPGADPRARLTATVDRHLDFALGQPNLYSFLCTEPRPAAETPAPTVTSLAAALAGVVPAEQVARVALVLAAEVHGLVHLRHGGRIDMAEPDFRAFCHEAVDRILDGPAG